MQKEQKGANINQKYNFFISISLFSRWVLPSIDASQLHQNCPLDEFSNTFLILFIIILFIIILTLRLFLQKGLF